MIEELKKIIENNIRNNEKRKIEKNFKLPNVVFNKYSKEEIEDAYGKLTKELDLNFVEIDYSDIVILYTVEEQKLYKVSSENLKYNFGKLLTEEEYNNLMNTLSTKFLIIGKMSGRGNEIFINDYTKNLLNSKKTILHIYNIEDHISSVYRRFLLDFTKSKCANHKLLLNFILASISFSNEIDKHDSYQIREIDGKSQFLYIINK